LATTRAVAWQGLDPDRIEVVRAALGADRLLAEGSSSLPGSLLHYRLVTGSDWVTRRLRVAVWGDGWARTLRLERAEDGTWRADASRDGMGILPPPGCADPSALTGALDGDLGLCPFTNTMPILRHDLVGRRGAPPARPLDLRMAWVSVPDLAVTVSPQRYRHLRRLDLDSALVEYRALDSEFRAELVVDGDGLVVDYPDLARRIALV